MQVQVLVLQGYPRLSHNHFMTDSHVKCVIHVLPFFFLLCEFFFSEIFYFLKKRCIVFFLHKGKETIYFNQLGFDLLVDQSKYLSTVQGRNTNTVGKLMQNNSHAKRNSSTTETFCSTICFHFLQPELLETHN